jgi:hypothetical protein
MLTHGGITTELGRGWDDGEAGGARLERVGR